MTSMSQAEYARHRGVSRQAISKLVKAEKIPLDAAGRIDVAAADYALGEVRESIDDESPEPTPRSDAPPRFAGEGIQLTKARTATEVYRARIAQLEFEERTGKLLPVDQVRQAMERCAEALVRDIDQLPSFADDIAAAFAAGGLAGLRDELKKKSRQFRETLARTMSLTAKADDESDDEEQRAA